MPERLQIDSTEAKKAAENISKALGGVDSPVDAEYFENNFDSIFLDDDVWQTFNSFIYILTKDHSDLLTQLEIHVDLVVLTEYMNSLRLDMLEQMKSTVLERELPTYREILAPVAEAATLAGREDVGAKILEALSRMVDEPFDAVTDLYEQLQVVKEIGIITEQPDLANFETAYEMVQKLFNWALETKLNYKEWEHLEE